MTIKQVRKLSLLMVSLTMVTVGFVLAATPQRGNQPAVGEVTVPNLGLKLIQREESVLGGRPMVKLEIVAVQEGSSAYFAGLQAGDQIVKIGGGGSINIEQFLYIINRTSRPGSPIGLWVDYLVSTTGARSDYPVTVHFEVPGQGRWITTKLQHTALKFPNRQSLPGMREAQEAMTRQLQLLYDRTLADIDANPCGRDIDALRKPLEDMAEKAHIRGIGVNLYFRAENGCQNKTQGGLPEFESLVYAMNNHLIDACSYNPTTDYNRVLSQARNMVGRKTYDDNAHHWLTPIPSNTTQRAPQKRSIPDPVGIARERACLLDFIQASLTGTPFKPRTINTVPPPATDARVVRMIGRWAGKTRIDSRSDENDCTIVFRWEGDALVGRILLGPRLFLRDIELANNQVTAKAGTPDSPVSLKLNLVGETLKGQGTFEFNGRTVTTYFDLKRVSTSTDEN